MSTITIPRNSTSSLSEFVLVFPDVGDESQAWFWTEEWQRMNAEAEDDLAHGRFREFETIDEFLDYLESEDGP